MTKARDISKLSAVEVNATADQTDAEVKALAESFDMTPKQFMSSIKAATNLLIKMKVQK